MRLVSFRLLPVFRTNYLTPVEEFFQFPHQCNVVGKNTVANYLWFHVPAPNGDLFTDGFALLYYLVHEYDEEQRTQYSTWSYSHWGYESFRFLVLCFHHMPNMCFYIGISWLVPTNLSRMSRFLSTAQFNFLSTLSKAFWRSMKHKYSSLLLLFYFFMHCLNGKM